MTPRTVDLDAIINTVYDLVERRDARFSFVSPSDPNWKPGRTEAQARFVDAIRQLFGIVRLSHQEQIYLERVGLSEAQLAIPINEAYLVTLPITKPIVFEDKQPQPVDHNTSFLVMQHICLVPELVEGIKRQSVISDDGEAADEREQYWPIFLKVCESQGLNDRDHQIWKIHHKIQSILYTNPDFCCDATAMPDSLA